LPFATSGFFHRIFLNPAFFISALVIGKLDAWTTFVVIFTAFFITSLLRAVQDGMLFRRTLRIGRRVEIAHVQIPSVFPIVARYSGRQIAAPRFGTILSDDEFALNPNSTCAKQRCGDAPYSWFLDRKVAERASGPWATTRLPVPMPQPTRQKRHNAPCSAPSKGVISISPRRMPSRG
jgi:hypothetical protein